MEKYVMTDVAKDTFPVPIGNKILDTYGKVINGKINEDIVNIIFIIKLSLSDFFFIYFHYLTYLLCRS